MAGEADLLLQLECENLYLLIDLWEAIRRQVVEPSGLEIVGLQEGFARGDGKAHIGFFDGTSNLQQKMRDDPVWYRSHIYLPTPGPAYPGQAIGSAGDKFQVRDDPRYDGGTYMVYRKYGFDLEAWQSRDFTITDGAGKSHCGEDARKRAIGRDPASGKAISRASHKLLEANPTVPRSISLSTKAMRSRRGAATWRLSWVHSRR